MVRNAQHEKTESESVHEFRTQSKMANRLAKMRVLIMEFSQCGHISAAKHIIFLLDLR